MISKMIGVIISAGVGVIISVMGRLIWKKEKLFLMHDYHVSRVSVKQAGVLQAIRKRFTDVCCNAFHNRPCI